MKSPGPGDEAAVPGVAVPETMKPNGRLVAETPFESTTWTVTSVAPATEGWHVTEEELTERQPDGRPLQTYVKEPAPAVALTENTTFWPT